MLPQFLNFSLEIKPSLMFLLTAFHWRHACPQERLSIPKAAFTAFHLQTSESTSNPRLQTPTLISNIKVTLSDAGRAVQRAPKDTEAPIGDLQVPEVDAQVVGRQVRGVVAVDGDGVDVVGVRVGERPARAGLHHQVHGLQRGHLPGAQPWAWALLAPREHISQHRGTTDPTHTTLYSHC